MRPRRWSADVKNQKHANHLAADSGARAESREGESAGVHERGLQAFTPALTKAKPAKAAKTPDRR
jgi:hypothetical protein